LRVLEQEGCVYFIYVRKSLTPLHAELKDALMARSWSRSTWMAYWDAGCNSTRAGGGWMDGVLLPRLQEEAATERQTSSCTAIGASLRFIGGGLGAMSYGCNSFGALRARRIALPTIKISLTQGKITAIATPHGKSQVPTAGMDHLKTAATCQTAVTYRLTDTGRCTGRMWKVATADSPNSMLVTHTLHLR
jgi:hypothetical protein